MKTIPRSIRFRTLLIGVAFSIFFSIIAAKAVYLQVYRGKWLSERAENQYKKSVVSTGKRGIIYDANHRTMAVSIDVMSIAAWPRKILNPKTAATALSAALHLNRNAVYKKLVSKKMFVWLKRKATPKETKAVRALNLDGINFIAESSRFYPNKTLAAQLIGFTGLDGHGLEGLEFYYDSYLQGSPVKHRIFRDARGREFDIDKKPSYVFSGNHLILTIDGTVQYIAERVLEETVRQHSAKSALAIVMIPKTGAILALAHYPIFNPNDYRSFDQSVWRNRAITDPFEPGSTMKIFSAAAALESGLASANTIFFCENGAYRIGKDVVHDIHAYGWLSLQQIIKFSSNIGAVKVSEMIGPEYHYNILKSFGFGSKTGIDCPGETNGTLIPYRRWSKIDAGAISFGQGISVSALQLVTATSAIANNGILMKPYVVDSIVDPNGRIIKKMTPRKVRRVVSAKTAATLNRVMQTVITREGTGAKAALDGYTVCGKTGTAQKTDSSGTYAKDRYTASFVGFAPAKDPAITILVVVDEPRTGYYGGIVAGPAFRKIAQETLCYLSIPPEKMLKRLRVLREVQSLG
ncbi:MAG: penicillin-binding protein 2 [Deltaproteobacteria bacterium]|nr:penicillin-binding protein 2 [Deltaproteobacteria bacterium]